MSPDKRLHSSPSGTVPWTLSPLPCPLCGKVRSHSPQIGKARAAYGIDDCLRKCTPCKVGYSNARVQPTVIYGDACASVPIEVRDGLIGVLSNALNVRNRSSKLAKFGFSTSEDALTWTVFSYLAAQGLLCDALLECGVSFADRSPALLLWGVPVDDKDGTGATVHW
jgi:hypothetical protein